MNVTIADFKLKGLTGREYKLLLKPEKFIGTAETAAKRFWTKHLRAIVAGYRKPRTNGRFEKLFPQNVRAVRFYDTGGLELDARGYSLRLRHGRTDGAMSEITLKLRSPDIFESGLATPSVGESDDERVKEKFEEDIAPLEVQEKAGRVAAPPEPSTRSRFSRSIQRERAEVFEVERFQDATRLFPSLRRDLRSVGATIPPGSKLNPGPPILEYVFEAEGVALKAGIKIDIALTLWYFYRDKEPDEQTKPRVAEISFQWNTTKNAAVTLAQTRCAQNLFCDMQKRLESWINMDDSSKTELALPPRKKSSRGVKFAAGRAIPHSPRIAGRR